MKALVTGATGFVGGHLVESLLAAGDQVTAGVRSPSKAKGLARRGVSIETVDLAAPEALVRAIAGHDVVFHVAGLTAARDEAEFLTVNRDGTAAVVAAAEAAGVARLVLVSSLAAAGPTTPGRPLLGTEPPAPVTRYGRSKLAGEAAVQAGRVPWTIVRPPAVYGPGDREMFRVFRAASLGLAPVFGDGSQALSLVFAPDLAAALVAVVRADAAIGRIYHACHPETVTTRRLVEVAAQAAGRRARVIPIPHWLGRSLLAATDAAARLARRATILSADKAAEFFAPAWLGDPAPLTRDTGWSARHDIESGAAITTAWYRSQGWL